MVFLISIDPDGTRRSHLAFSKTRVKPLNKHLKTLSKEMSVCRLELLAALLAATIGVFIQSAFKEQLKVRYFTDSQITLYRLLNDPLTFRPWVSNRLRQIKELTNVQDWYYIRSEVNVASDLSSRGCSLTELLNSKDYWHGPPFLCDPDHDYQEMSITAIQLKKNIKQILDEEKKIAKPTCLSFGNPTFDCSQIEKGDTSGSMISHQLCLEGPPDTMVMDADFKAFWLKDDKDQPKNRGLALRFPSWGKLRGVGGRILQFVHAARNGWWKKATKSQQDSR